MFFSRPAGHKYVDRGDVQDYDWTKIDLIADNEQHDLDLSSIIPIGTQLVAIVINLAGTDTVSKLVLRNKDNTADWNSCTLNTQHANYTITHTKWVKPNADRLISYRLGAVTWGFVNLVVKGWLV